MSSTNFALRFKRKDTTVFLFVEASSSFAKLKQRLFAHVGAKDASELRLFAAEKEGQQYADEALVSDFPITDQSVFFVCLPGEEPPKLQ